MSKLLIVDDDMDIRNLLRVCLENEGFLVVEASNGKEALDLFDHTIDLVVLDIMMPIMDGIAACMALRKITDVPILFLTAKSQDSDMILGLQIGADDYVKKPFTPPVLTAKIKAMLRRCNLLKVKSNDHTIIIDDLVIDINAHTIEVDNQAIQLTKTEFEILTLLAKHKGQVFSIQRIYEAVWGEDYFDASSNTVMVHIKKLRGKIDSQDRTYIKTVWGVGYKLE